MLGKNSGLWALIKLATHNFLVILFLVGIFIPSQLQSMTSVDSQNIMDTAHLYIHNSNCSGIVIYHQKGIAITANHCIDESINENIDISMGSNIGNSRIQCYGKLFYSNESYDLALIDISQCKPRKSIKILHPSHDLLLGSKVFIFGNPMGKSYLNSLIVGYVSNSKRIDSDGSEYLQFNGGIWGGHSGGGILDNDGYIVSIVRAFAISPDIVSYSVPVGLPHVGLGIHRDTIVKFLSEYFNQYEMDEILSPRLKSFHGGDE